MTEIYIQRTHPRRGCLRVVLLLAGLAAVAVAAVLLLRRPANQPEEKTAAPQSEPAAAVPSAPSQPTSDPGPRLLADARKFHGANQLLEAREACHTLLQQSSNELARREAEKLLGEINAAIAFSPMPAPEKVDYTVQSGDTLDVLARKFGTTRELIQKGNSIQGALIRINQRLKILNGKFSASVDKSDNTLVLSLNDRFFKRYSVGTGKFQKTPVGTFEITDRIAQPTWWRDDGKAIPYGDPDNVLGTHWLSLSIPGYGLHGTWEPDTIGKQESAGCIRLLNPDIEELYALLPVGTPVTITD